MTIAVAEHHYGVKSRRVLSIRKGRPEPPRVGLGPGGKIVSGTPSKGGPAKNIYSKSEILTLSCRGTWAWSERVNLYNRQIMILPRSTKTCAT
jgi:hypothetical protein